MHGEIDPGAMPSAMPSQARSNQDWWFQYQEQQMAEQRAEGYDSSASAAAGLGIEAARSPPRVSMDIIKWPILLQRPTFASRRARIEAPYRRSPPGLSSPTAEDYRAMVKTAEEMKAMLEAMLQNGLETDEYNQAKSFLNEIEQEARDRSERGGMSPKLKS